MEPNSVIKILVYSGTTTSGSLSDLLYIQAFKKVFPEFNFTFVDKIDQKNITNCDAVFFGGGSFLNEPIKMEDNVRQKLSSMPIFYISIGLETDIHEDHLVLLSKARLIIARNQPETDKIKGFPAFRYPDLVYALKENITISKLPNKTLLFLPNAFVLPQNNDPIWKFTSWNSFKESCSSFLDDAIEEGWTVHFFSMCQNRNFDDTWAFVEIMDMMKYRDKNMLLSKTTADIREILSLFSSHSIVYTQRYHGIVLSDMAQRPCVSIAHHDKLNDANISFSYYGANKKMLYETLKNATLPKPPRNYSEKFNEIYYLVTNYLK